MLYVSYICDGTWMVAAGAGNIFGARSATKGIEGIEACAVRALRARIGSRERRASGTRAADLAGRSRCAQT